MKISETILESSTHIFCKIKHFEEKFKSNYFFFTFRKSLTIYSGEIFTNFEKKFIKSEESTDRTFGRMWKKFLKKFEELV